MDLSIFSDNPEAFRSLIFYLSLAMGISFICSILEAIILSISPSFISLKRDEGRSYAVILEGLKSDIDKPLTAILTLNTFANTFGAAGVGSQAQVIFQNEYISVVSAVVTVLILVFSEIIPKTIGATYWRQLSLPSTYILKGMVFILTPVVWIMNQITRIIKGKNGISSISRYEISAITEMGEKEGVLDKDESAIIKNLLQFNTILTEDIMTPRTVSLTVEENEKIMEFLKENSYRHFSRIPVYHSNKDNITGYVLKDELLVKVIDGNQDEKIKTLVRPIQKVNEHLTLPELYRLLTEKNEHIAVVQDDYGGFAGLVTMEDVIETLLGVEITDESDKIEDLQKFARKNWEYRARKIGILREDESYEQKNDDDQESSIETNK